MDEAAPSWRVVEQPARAHGGAEVGEPNGDPRTSAWLVIGGLLVALGLAVLAFVVASGGSSRGAVVDGALDDGLGAASASPGAGRADRPGPGASILVEVSGAVARPGLHRLPADARVADAIALAGGFGPRVDAMRADRELNLAAPLVDGSEIHVPSRDEPLPSAAPSGAGPGPASGGLIDLNRASAAELDELPGVGPATAAKIIAAREEQPFATVEDLRTRRVLGPATFEKVRDLVTTGP